MRRLIAFLLFAVGPIVLMLWSGPLILGALTLAYGDVSNVPPAVLGNLIFVSPLFPLFLGIIAIVALIYARIDVFALLGFGRTTIAADVLAGAVIGLIGLALALASLFLLAPLMTVPPFHAIPAPVHIYLATIGAVVPGVCEELYFRGLLFKIADRVPTWLRIGATSLSFSLWHISNPIYLAHTFILGLILGSAVATRGRLAPAIIGHTLANALFGVWILTGMPLPMA